MAKITDITVNRYDYNAERLGNVLGNKIKEARKRLKWSQLRLKEELEENGLELTTQALGKWEKGESVPNAYQFLLLSRVLGIKNPLEYFVSSSPRPELNEEGEDNPIVCWYSTEIGPEYNLVLGRMKGFPFVFTQELGEGRAVTYTAIEVVKGKVKDVDMLLPAGYKDASGEEFETFRNELKDAIELLED